MNTLLDFGYLLSLLAIAGIWLKLSRAREQAIGEARRQCVKYGLQLLDESVGLRALRLRRHHGRRVLERGYSFEVSIDGDDREPGQLWLYGGRMTGLKLPTVELQLGESACHEVTHAQSTATDNVIPLRLRNSVPRDTRH